MDNLVLVQSFNSLYSIETSLFYPTDISAENQSKKYMWSLGHSWDIQ